MVVVAVVVVVFVVSLFVVNLFVVVVVVVQKGSVQNQPEHIPKGEKKFIISYFGEVYQNKSQTYQIRGMAKEFFSNQR